MSFLRKSLPKCQEYSKCRHSGAIIQIDLTHTLGQLGHEHEHGDRSRTLEDWERGVPSAASSLPYPQCPTIHTDTTFNPLTGPQRTTFVDNHSTRLSCRLTAPHFRRLLASLHRIIHLVRHLIIKLVDLYIRKQRGNEQPLHKLPHRIACYTRTVLPLVTQDVKLPWT